MTDLETNKAFCRKFLGHLARIEVDLAVACLTDDIVWWVQGDWPNGNEHHGKVAFARLFDLVTDLLEGELTIELGAFTAEDDRVAVEMRSHAVFKNRKTYQNTYHYLFTLQDGLISQGKEYLDTKHLFETIFP
jgi:ketosteroid isomerase-like protein